MVQRDAKITVKEEITVEGALFYYLAPASLAGYIGTEMLDGAVGSFVE